MKRHLLKLFSTIAVLTFISFLILAAKISPVNAQTQKKPTQVATTSNVKIRQKMTSGGSDRAMETVIYVKGARMRNEMLSSGMAMMTVRQCDLKRTLMINDKTKTYLITPDGTGAAGQGLGTDGSGVASTAASNAQPKETRRGGIVNVTSTVTDTGERKQMFGFTARHIKTSTVIEASPEACNKGNHKSETDGWYIDFQYDFDCPEQKKIDTAPPVQTRPDCEDEIRTKTIGTAKLGFPVSVTTTIYDSNGKTNTVTQEVVELSREPLDASLFDVPAGYALAKNYQELYGMNDTTSQSGGSRTNSNAATGTSGAAISSAAATPAGFVAANAPKKEGAVRIGILMPKAQMSAGDAAQAAEAVRNTFASYLNGPNVEVVALAARLPSQALEEAKQSQCDYVLSASLTQKKGGGGGMFGKALGNIASSAIVHLPGGSTAGGAAARSATITGVHTAASISGSIKAKDELTLEYKLEATDGAKPGVANTAKAKAKSDGEDVFTPLVERAAQAIIDAVMKK
ncbi:MAG: DUF4412 domain-containing protein [Acidobacteria bacterium]|jgi:hypothetical protein|nr:DUF4412 domain-containing protein [Acidobacteriota bacterium]